MAYRRKSRRGAESHAESHAESRESRGSRESQEDDEWLLMSDSAVQTVGLDAVLASQPYMLFWEKIEAEGPGRARPPRLTPMLTPTLTPT